MFFLKIGIPDKIDAKSSRLCNLWSQHQASIRTGKSHSQRPDWKVQGLPCSIQGMLRPRHERGGDDKGVRTRPIGNPLY